MSKFSTINFDSKEELVDYYIEKLETENDTVIICDYEIAVQLSNLYHDEEFSEYYSIDIDRCSNVYLVSKFGQETFIIEKAKRRGEWVYGEYNNLIIQDDLLDDELFESVEVSGDIEILDYDSEECCNCSECVCQKQESEFEALSPQDKEYIDLMVEDVWKADLSDLKEVLAEIFNEGFTAGKNVTLLTVSDSLRDLIKY